MLNPVQTENVWRANTIKHRLVTKHFPFGHLVKSHLIVFDKMWMTTNIWSMIAKHFVRLNGDQTCMIPFGHSVRHQFVWPPNNVWSYLLVQNFPFGHDFTLNHSWDPLWLFPGIWMKTKYVTWSQGVLKIWPTWRNCMCYAFFFSDYKI